MKIPKKQGCQYRIKYKKILCGSVWDIKLTSIEAISGNCELSLPDGQLQGGDYCKYLKYFSDMYNEVVSRFLYEMLAELDGGTWRLIKPRCIMFENGKLLGSCSDDNLCCSELISAPKDTCDRWSIIPSNSYSNGSDDDCAKGRLGNVPCTEYTNYTEGVLPRVQHCIPGCTQTNFHRNQ